MYKTSLGLKYFPKIMYKLIAYEKKGQMRDYFTSLLFFIGVQ